MINKAAIAATLATFLVVLTVAQVSPPLAVFPLSTYLRIGPGETFSGSFTIENYSSEKVAITVSLADFIFDENGELIVLEPGTLGNYSLSPYIVYSPERITLGPDETCNVRFTFSIPLGATGPHWTALVVSPEQREEVTVEKPGEGLAFLVRLSWTYFFTIVQAPPNSGSPAGQIIGMDVRGVTAEDGSRKVTASLTFQNLVEDVLRCKVYFEVRNARGDKLARYDIPLEMLVLPRMVRIFTHTFEGLNWAPGQYLILGVVDFGGEYLAAGQYVATVKE
ncbi:MAG: hypothetical protein QXQ66_10040 [Candidatus Hadarchaeum sp.]|uniref:hypothetical protein n=1 Tax=Candidatus Hadarchaeum sp. TaxID=2883567 RepID=UPI0031815619